MSSVVIAGDTSGTVTLAAPAVSGTTTLTLPATTGTVVTKDTNGILSVNGVQFPATQSASADANCLDDYEEGTFTPTVGGTSITYAVRAGRYVKIGRLVQFQLYIALSGGTPTSIIGGLPFTVINLGVDSDFGMDISAYVNNGITFAAGRTYASPYAAVGSTTINYSASGSNINATDVTIANNASFHLSGTYQASA
jgi:hypothetical protein